MSLSRYQYQLDISGAYFFDDFEGSQVDSRTYYSTGASGGSFAVLPSGLGGVAALWSTTNWADWNVTFGEKDQFVPQTGVEFRCRVKLAGTQNVQFGVKEPQPVNNRDASFDLDEGETTWYVSSSGSRLNTGVPTDTLWHEFRIVLNSASITYYIDNVVVAVSTTGMPTNPVTGFMKMNPSTHAPCGIYVDWVELFGPRAPVSGYVFSSSTEGWTYEANGVVTGLAQTTFDGRRSLQATLTAAGEGFVYKDSPDIPGGSFVTYSVYVPTGCTAVQPFVQQGAGGGWQWTGNYISSNLLTLDGWNTFMVPVPEGAAALYRVGVQFFYDGSAVRQAYISSVTWGSMTGYTWGSSVATDVENWHGEGTGVISGLTQVVYYGRRCLCVDLTGSGTEMCLVNSPSPSLSKGTEVRYTVYLPDGVNGIVPFILEGPPTWRWTGGWEGSGSYQNYTWITFTRKVPDDADPINAVGIQFQYSGGVTRQAYIDCVVW
jgi:hypothetical protein